MQPGLFGNRRVFRDLGQVQVHRGVVHLVFQDFEPGGVLLQLSADIGQSGLDFQEVGHGCGLVHQLQKPGLLGFQGGDAALGVHILQRHVLSGTGGGDHVARVFHSGCEFLQLFRGDADRQTGAAVAAAGVEAAVILALVLDIAAEGSRLFRYRGQSGIQVLGLRLNVHGDDELLPLGKGLAVPKIGFKAAALEK